MEQFAPKQWKYKNHGGGNKPQQRRYYNQQHNPNYSSMQNQQLRSTTPYSPFLTYSQPGQKVKSNVGSAPKKNTLDEQELLCPKCTRYYQVINQEHPIGNYRPSCYTCTSHELEATQQTNKQHPLIPAGFSLHGPAYSSLPPYQQPFQQSQLPQQASRLPYVLPCDHTICGDCIRHAHAQRAVKCPECDVCAAIDVDRETDKSFAINYYLVGRIYLLRHQSIISTPNMSNYQSAGGDPFPRFVRSNALAMQQQQQPFNYNQKQPFASMQGMAAFGGGEPSSLDLNSMSLDSACPFMGPKCSMGHCKSPAAFYCNECKSIFCSSCSNVLHGGEIAGLKDHRIRPLQLQMLAACPQHSASVLDFHCVSCDVDVCCYCFIENGHAGHEHVRLTVLSEDQKAGFKELIVNIEGKLRKLENTYKVAEQHINVSMDPTNLATGDNKQHQQVVANVNKHFADLMAKLLNTHHRLRQKLDMAQHASVGSLRAIQSEVSQRLVTGNSLLSQGRLVLNTAESNKPGAAIFNVAMLKLELEQMLEWPSCLVNGREGDDKTAGNIEFISDLSENLDKFCALKVRDADQFQLVHEDSIPDGFAIAKLPEIVQHDSADTSSQSSSRSNISSMASTSRQSEFNKPSRLPSALSVSKMPPAKQSSNSIAIPNIGGRHSVTVVHINNPESIYIQLIENLPILKSIHNDLANYVKSLTATEVHDPQMGECYIVKQNIHWARARCIKPSKKPEFYVVQLLETGQAIEIPQLHMRECNSQFRQVPPMSYQCRLNNLYPINKVWSIEAKKLLENILAVKSGYVSPFGARHKIGGVESCNVTMQVFGRQNGVYSVQLVASREDTSTMLSHALLFTGLAKPIDSSNEETDIKTVEGNKIYENSSKMDVNQRTRVTVVHVEDPYNIYVHLHNFLSHIKDLLRNMNIYYLENNRGIIYTPKIGMNVSIQYTENQSYNWYRGRIIDVTYGTGKVVVLLIDFGKIVNVEYKNLRTLPQNFTVLECQAVHIRLADIAPPDSPSNSCDTAAWPEATMEFLREFIMYSGHHLEIAVLEGDNAEAQQKGHLVVLFECLPTVHYCINAQLVEAGLAKSTGQFSSSDNIAWPQGGMSLDDNSSDDARSHHRHADKHHHQSSAASHHPHKSLLRMIEGTPSFTLDLLKTIQGSEGMQIEQEDDDDDDESIAMGRMEVDVLLVKSPDEIYIKVKSRDSQVVQIEPDLVRRLQLHYGGGAAASERENCDYSWRKGDNIVAYNYHTAQFHRGILQQVPSEGKEQYMVLCRDRAIEFKTEYSTIYPLSEEFEGVPYLAKRIRLANIQPLLHNQWPLFASDVIRNMCNQDESDSPDSNAANQKYYYRKTGNAHDLGDGGEMAQPGILWVCTLISCGPLERSRYQYRSVNKKLVRSGVAVSDKTNHPNIVRRQPQVVVNPPPAAEQPQTQKQTTKSKPALTPSHTANAVMRAFAELTEDDVLLSSVADVDEDDSGTATSGIDVGIMGIIGRKKMTSYTTGSSSSVKSGEEPINNQPPITSYVPSIPLPERRFTAIATYVDETAHIYLYPEQMTPIMIKLSENIQHIVNLYNQKVLLPSPGKRSETYKVGELCTVQYFRDRKWYRGKITHVMPFNTAGSSGFEYRVQMVDYGNVEQVKPSELCDLVLCPTVPLITTRIRMHQVEPKCGPWNTSILDAIHNLVVSKTLHVLLCDKTHTSILVPNAIITRADGENINDYLLEEFDCLCRGKEIDIPKDDSDDDVVILEESETPETTLVEETSQPVFNYEDLELMPRLQVGDKRIVKVVDIIEINVIAVKLLPENMQQLENTYEEIFASFQDPAIDHLPLKEMRAGVVCLARFSADGMYYRAEIMGVITPKTRSLTSADDIPAPESAHIFFIDYGNREVVARCHLRSISPYDPRARHLPSLVRMVALHSIRLPPKSPDHMQDVAMYQLTELLQQQKVTMEVVRNEPKVSVNLLDPQTGQLVYESLISQGLIVYADNDESDNSDNEYHEYN